MNSVISTFSDKFTLKNFKLGYVRLSDGTNIILRVAIVDIRPLQTCSPFGVEFNVVTVSGISVYPSESVLNEVKDKPTVERFPDHVISRYFLILFDPWSELALGVVSSASTTPHGARSRLTP